LLDERQASMKSLTLLLPSFLLQASREKMKIAIIRIFIIFMCMLLISLESDDRIGVLIG